MRRLSRAPLPLLLPAAAAVLLTAAPAAALDPPHNFSNYCDACHVLHNAPGPVLTDPGALGNICLSCHATKPNVSGWADGDQADQAGTRSSHSWSAPAVNGAIGTTLPTTEAILIRLNDVSGTKYLACSACHDQHMQQRTPFDPGSSATAGAAGRHFQRVNNDTNQLCVDCHANRNIDTAEKRAWSGNPLSHPVGFPLSGSFYSPPRDVFESGQASAGDKTSLTVSGSPWTPGALEGYEVTMRTGGNARVTRRIKAGNTANTITFDQFDVNVNGGDTYVITGGAQAAALFGTASGGDTTSLTVSGSPWTAGALVGLVVRFTSGAGIKNQLRTITANGTSSLSWTTPLGSPVTNGITFEVDNDGNTSNNLPLADASGTSYSTGNVACLSCHAPHYADSDPTTYDDQPRQGDGRLLRRGATGSADFPDEACVGCHNVQVHNSNNVQLDEIFGLDFKCSTCHDPHGSPNIKLIKAQIQTPNSGLRSVDFRDMTSGGNVAYGLANSAAQGSGPCEVCHTKTTGPGGPRYRNDGSGPAGHFEGVCVGCHPHDKGFQPQDEESKGGVACASCHIYRMIVGDTGVSSTYHHVLEISATITSGQAVYPTDTTPTLALDADKACVQCHVDHNIFRPSENPNSTMRANNLRTDAGVTPTQTGGFTNRDANGAGGVCLSCHTNPQDKNNSSQAPDGNAGTAALPAADFSTSPHAYGVNGKITNDDAGENFTVACTKCHSSDPEWDVPTDPKAFGDGYGTTPTMVIFQGNPGTPTPAEVVNSLQLYMKAGTELPVKTNENVEPKPNDHSTGDVFQNPISGWTSRSASPESTCTTCPLETYTTTFGKQLTPKYWRAITLVSPPASVSSVIATGRWEMNVNARVSNTTSTVYIRWAVYQWCGPDTNWTADCTASDTKGKTIVPPTNATTPLDTTASPGRTFNLRLDTAPAVTLRPGDKVVVDLEYYSSSTSNGSSGSYFLGTSGGRIGDLRIPTAVDWEMTPEIPAPPDTSPRFALHTSNNRRLLAPMGMTSPGDPLGEDFCFRCHSQSTDTNPGGGPAKSQAGKDYYSDGTSTWSTMTGQSERLFAVFSGGTYGFDHPVQDVDATARHDISEGEASNWNPGSARHVQCEDCHDPHGTQTAGVYVGTVSAYGAGTPDTLTASGSPGWASNAWRGYSVRMLSGGQVGKTSAIWGNTANQLSVEFATSPATNDQFTIVNLGRPDAGNQSRTTQDAWGLSPSWPAQPSPPGWNDVGLATQAEDNAQFTAIVSDAAWGRSAPVSTNPGLCIKCHSAYAFGGSPPNTPSGTGNSGSGAWSNTVGGNVAQSDIAYQFSPNNLSHHAVFARGKNQPVRANFGDLGGAGTVSYYNLGGNPVVLPWPKYSTANAGDTVGISNGTATLNGTAQLPAAVLPGWYLFIGSDTPSASYTGTGTTGYLEITSIASATSFTVRAEDGAGGFTTAITVSPATASWFVTAGLGNTFVPPYGPWSTLKCDDCHASDGASDPLGPHGSGTKWLLKQAEAKSFLAYEGASPALTTVTTSPGDAYHFCQNCHRRDVYGDPGLTGPGNAFYSRQPHPVDRSSANAHTTRTAWGIACLGCHGGARIGSIHGSNLGKGLGQTDVSWSGRRLLNGATWNAVLRSSTTYAGACWTKGSTDVVNNCSQSHDGTGFGGANSGKATYDFESSKTAANPPYPP